LLLFSDEDCHVEINDGKEITKIIVPSKAYVAENLFAV
jgi:hypothetical protein